jgi:hypothetical protein
MFVFHMNVWEWKKAPVQYNSVYHIFRNGHTYVLASCKTTCLDVWLGSVVCAPCCVVHLCDHICFETGRNRQMPSGLQHNQQPSSTIYCTHMISNSFFSTIRYALDIVMNYESRRIFLVPISLVTLCPEKYNRNRLNYFKMPKSKWHNYYLANNP